MGLIYCRGETFGFRKAFESFAPSAFVRRGQEYNVDIKYAGFQLVRQQRLRLELLRRHAHGTKTAAPLNRHTQMLANASLTFLNGYCVVWVRMPIAARILPAGRVASAALHASHTLTTSFFLLIFMLHV
jgi:hypothetical protein